MHDVHVLMMVTQRIECCVISKGPNDIEFLVPLGKHGVPLEHVWREQIVPPPARWPASAYVQRWPGAVPTLYHAQETRRVGV
ncbi:hypothetical protein [Bordetella holmesii]|uniref:hypothetical protein n=1 Tax=Bordetella holmesii TaxID=35814 RepID=UPI0002BAB2B2|nr:hypothetical protein [Bordetella holmesii]AMD44025.1 hypothetical protein H558_00050 [Bordetella holmesii H558]EWM49404.1 hypothetical protein D555_0020 [Bordetella holmesii 35009]AMD50742.1 hypothetical protein F783_018070 [Bordetella holmesii F627]AOB36134.1 hypothetical protein BBB42_11860 [Bordetella holmesii]AUL20106.1 hypothetical protein BTL46_11955 [Bordetella holmesii]